MAVLFTPALFPRTSVRVRSIVRLALLFVAASTVGAAQTPPPTFPVTTYKSLTCGCCGKWNEHMRASGFTVTNNDLTDVTPIKDKQGVPTALRSCHTALVGGYVVEGHVPADVVRKLLRERPAVVGIAVPGMPMGSPGMEGPRQDAYDVIAFDKTGKTSVYAKK
jgi:hypothetical protein